MTNELSKPSEEEIKKIQDEIREEFYTSSRSVYKEGLRSLIVQEQKLTQQIEKINLEIQELQKVKEALTTAYINGELRSVTDLHGVIRRVSHN